MPEQSEGVPIEYEDLRALILEYWQAFQGTLNQYQWPWETARWHELAFCLLMRSGQPELSAGTARRLTSTLAELNLLQIEMLSRLTPDGGEPDLSHPDLDLMLRLLQRSGLNEAKATATVTTICQAAHSLQQYHGGKVQHYLRQYGQQMLDELGEHFVFSSISQEDARYAFTHWLQNVLNLPLPISNPAVEAFCHEQGVTVPNLVRVADELDLNLALLDDMLSGSS